MITSTNELAFQLEDLSKACGADDTLRQLSVSYLANVAHRLRELEKDAKRYQWLCDKGHSYHGAMAGTGSMSICRGPYILLELPSHNKFSNMILTKQAADVIIDKAISEEAQ